MDKALHALISHLYRGGTQVAADQFQTWALAELQRLVPFDAAVWGMGNQQRARFHNVQVFGLPNSFADALEKTTSLNPVYAHLPGQVGEPICMEDVFDDQAFYRSDLYNRSFQPFGVERIMSSGHADTRSGLYTLLSLYRFDREANFSDRDRQRYRILARHMVSASSHVYFLHLTRPRPAHSDRVAAVVDGQGVIHEVQPGFLDLLEQHYPEWAGERLPFAIGGEQTDSGVDRLHVSAQRMADLYLVRIWERSALDSLTARERDVVEAVCRGLSHKAVGQQMGLASTTVSSHLYRAYNKLGVHSRTELARLMHGQADAGSPRQR